MFDFALYSPLFGLFTYLFASFVILASFATAALLVAAPVLIAGIFVQRAFDRAKKLIFPWAYMKMVTKKHGTPEMAKLMGIGDRMVNGDIDEGLKVMGEAIIAFAEKNGRVVTIEMQKPWYRKPAMGASEMTLDVRKSLETIRDEDEKAEEQ